MLNFDIRLKQSGFVLDVACVMEGASLGIYGPSGSGKSTLLHCLAGLKRPQEGVIALNGIPLFDSERKVNVPPHRRRVGVVFQDSRLFPHMTTRQNLTFGLKQTPAPERRFDLEEVAGLLELGSLLDKPAPRLSGGEQQRVAIGRAILSSPQLLLLDEPLSSLDPRLKREILPFLLRIRESTRLPMAIVSHDLSELVYLTENLLIMERGLALHAGPYDRLIQDGEFLDHMRDQGLVNVLTLQMIDRDEANGFMVLRPPDLPQSGPARDYLRDMRIRAPLWSDCSAERPLRIMMRPEDIALSLRPARDVSIQNQIPCICLNIVRRADVTYCLLDIGRPLLAEVTHETVTRLGLAPGKPLWALFKTTALRLLAPNAAGSQWRACPPACDESALAE